MFFRYLHHKLSQVQLLAPNLMLGLISLSNALKRNHNIRYNDPDFYYNNFSSASRNQLPNHGLIFPAEPTTEPGTEDDATRWFPGFLTALPMPSEARLLASIRGNY